MQKDQQKLIRFTPAREKNVNKEVKNSNFKLLVVALGELQ